MAYIPVTIGRRKALSSVRLSHSGGGSSNLIKDDGSPSVVTFSTAGWLEIFSSSTKKVNMVEIFSSSGEIEMIGTGAVASEVVLSRIIPGGSGLISLRIDNATRIVVKPESANPTSGSELIINFFE